MNKIPTHKKQDPDTEDWRLIELQLKSQITSSIYKSNKVTSARYTFFTFLPLNLFDQFMRPSNIWFLYVSILELSVLSDQERWFYGTSIPLLILLVLTAIKDAISDYQRSKGDGKTNNEQHLVWNGNSFSPTKSEDILVGQVVLLQNKEKAPADLILFCSGSPNFYCYLDTSGILGERDLKIKSAVRELQTLIDVSDVNEASAYLKLINGQIKVQAPNKDFSSFSGKLILENSPKASNITIDNFIFRGAKICNTPWIFGLVVYTGSEGKTWKMKKSYIRKSSVIEKQVNKIVIILIGIVLILSLFEALMATYNSDFDYENHGHYIFFKFNSIFSQLVPLPLFVIIDLVRWIRGWRIEKEKGGIQFKTSDIHENLGQIEYLLTDKTGTLTQDNLTVQLCIVGDNDYWEGTGSADELRRVGRVETRINNYQTERPFIENDSFVSATHTSFQRKSIVDLKADFLADQTDEMTHYFTCFALCNMAFPLEYGDYLTTVAEDKILLEMSKIVGVSLTSRDSYKCKINILDQTKEYLIWGLQDASRENKRTRIVVQNSRSDEVLIYVKGSLDAMLEILKDPHDKLPFLENILKEQSTSSLQFIVAGYRVLKHREAQEFKLGLRNAKQCPVNSERRIESVFEEIEIGVNYLGCVGIQEEIREDTKNTVKILRNAGIKLWILSGDSEESTISAGIGSSAIQEHYEIIRLCQPASEVECYTMLQEALDSTLFKDNSLKKNSSKDVFKESGPLRTPPESPMQSAQDYEYESSMTDKDNAHLKHLETAREPSLPTLNQRAHRLSNELSLKRGSINPLISKLTSFSNAPIIDINRPFSVGDLSFVLSVDKKTLDLCLGNPSCRKLLVILLFTSQSACFHSLLPDDKTKVAKLLKQNFSFKPAFLAIGDSESDVGMIQEAHVGIGIMGNEGVQAANASDIVIKQFSDLTRLILCEGHWSYSNISKIILIIWYKSVFIISLIFFFSLLDEYSGALIDALSLGYYIMVLNIANLIGMGVFDQQLTGNEIAEYPEMHSSGVYSTFFNSYYIFNYCLQGVGHAGILTIFLRFGVTDIVKDAGYTENLLILRCITIILATMMVQALSILETNSYCKKTLAFQVVSFGIFVVVLIAYSFDSPMFDLYGFLSMIFSSPRLIVSMIMLFFIFFLISYTVKTYSALFAPTLIDFINALKIRVFDFEIISRVNQYENKLEKVFKGTSKYKAEVDSELFEINLFMLHFKSPLRREEYNKGKYMSRLKPYRLFIAFITIFAIIALIVHFAREESNIMVGTEIIITLCLSIGYLIISWSKYFINNLRCFIIAYYLIILFIALTATYEVYVKNATIEAVYPLTFLLAFNVDWIIQVVCNCIITIFVILKVSRLFDSTFSSVDLTVTAVQYMIFWLTIDIACLIVAYNIELSSLNEFILIKKVRTEMLKAKDVLELLMPKFVLKRVKDGIRYIADDQGIVSVLFCNICDFDLITIDFTPQEITSMLDDIYGKFDQLCELVGVTKIETVGKTYMACAGLKDSESELDTNFRSVPHARRVIEMGIEIINCVQKMTTRNGEPLHVQIGINSGPVTAGVVGAHKPQYSLVGDTVNTASRMATTLKDKNAIQISNSTYELLGNKRGLLFIPQIVYAKGKGNMETFIVKVDNIPPEGLLTDFTRRGDTVKTTLSLFMSGSMLMPTISMHVSSFSDLPSPGLITMETKKTSGLYTNLINGEKEKVFKKKETSLEKMSVISFKCYETEEEAAFRKLTLEDNYINLNSELILGLLSDSCSLIIQIVWVATDNYNTLFFIVYFPFEIAGFLLLLWLLNENYKEKWYAWCLQLFFALGSLSFILASVWLENDLNQLVGLGALIHIMLLTHGSMIFFGHIIAFAVLATLGWIVAGIFVDIPDIVLRQTIYMVGFVVLCLVTLYYRVKKLWTYSHLRTNSQNELNTIEELVNKMMPPHAYMNLKDKHSVTDRFSQVTILYADIVGFTAWSSDKAPDEILGMLYELFSRFDNLCLVHNVYKVHTIGDCYVAMGYTGNTKNRDPGQECVNMVEFAQAMINIIQEVNEINGINLNMRIGMHTGDVIGGIIGRYIVRYDIYGSGVLVANLMESNGIPGEIAISEVTQMLLKRFRPSKYTFQHVNEINVPVLQRSYKIYTIHNSL
ncbi:unnamed protein product [Blepharisma stoltei]|uniref:Guanylate cyclase domain-containing protein n=1 Tax=Blepharisma stoltei TaxID=1481888 RepID=A0AAU9IH92_9CILI|nr:unnamed protein product [Blepharisma stoltei]